MVKAKPSVDAIICQEAFSFRWGDLMSPESFKRKLTAILSADVKGYSRLMGEDEAETVKTLTAYRKIMGELIHAAPGTSHRLAGGQHPGRVRERR